MIGDDWASDYKQCFSCGREAQQGEMYLNECRACQLSIPEKEPTLREQVLRQDITSSTDAMGIHCLLEVLGTNNLDEALRLMLKLLKESNIDLGVIKK